MKYYIYCSRLHFIIHYIQTSNTITLEARGVILYAGCFVLRTPNSALFHQQKHHIILHIYAFQASTYIYRLMKHSSSQMFATCTVPMLTVQMRKERTNNHLLCVEYDNESNY